MNTFTYSYPVKVDFGEQAAEKNLAAELAKHGKTVMLAYGGGSIKKNGVYDELTGILKAAGREIIEFTGVMSNPTYTKVQEIADSVTLTAGGYGRLTHEDVLKIFEACR